MGGIEVYEAQLMCDALGIEEGTLVRLFWRGEEDVVVGRFIEMVPGWIVIEHDDDDGGTQRVGYNLRFVHDMGKADGTDAT